MAIDEHRRGVPEDWFVDPVHLGVPGVRRVSDDDNALSWQADSLCAQTDPEAFFPEKAARLATPRRSAPPARCALSVSNTRCRMTSASATGAGSPNGSVANSASERSRVLESDSSATQVPWHCVSSLI